MSRFRGEPADTFRGSAKQIEGHKAVVLRTGPRFSILETEYGDSVYYETQEFHHVVPGQLVTVKRATWSGEHQRYTGEKVEADRVSEGQWQLALKAESLYMEGLAARQERDLLTAGKRLYEALETGLAGAQAYIVLADIELEQQRHERCLRVLKMARDKLSVAVSIAVAIAERLAKANRPRDALALILETLERPDFPRSSDLETLAARFLLDAVFSGRRTRGDESAAVPLKKMAERLAKSGYTDQKLAGPEFASAICTWPDIVDIAASFQALGFEVSPLRRYEDGVSLVVQARPERLQGLEAVPDISRKIRVRLWHRLPAWTSVEDEFRVHQDWRKGDEEKATYWLSVHDDISSLEEAYRRSRTDYGSTAVAFPVQKLSAGTPDLQNELRDLLVECVGRTDLFSENRPVHGETFFGREQEFQKFAQHVAAGHHVGVFGLRKTGKTSFLKQLAHVREDDLIVYLDLQSIVVPEVAYVWWKVAKELRKSYMDWRKPIQKHVNLKLGAKKRYDVDKPSLNASRFDSEVVSLVNSMIQTPQTQNSRIVLALDEIEYLLPKGEGSISSGEDFFRWARGISQQTDGRVVIVVTAANPRLSELATLGDRDNPMFQFCEELYVPPLPLDECSLMISSLGKRMGISFSEEALHAIHEETAGHPYVARKFCSFIVNTFDYPREVDELMVSDSVHAFCSNSDVFEEIVGRLEDQFPNEYAMLELIHEGGCRKREELENLSGEPIERALRHLLGYHLIVEEEQTLRLKFGMLRRWMDRRRRIQGKV